MGTEHRQSMGQSMSRAWGRAWGRAWAEHGAEMGQRQAETGRDGDPIVIEPTGAGTAGGLLQLRYGKPEKFPGKVPRDATRKKTQGTNPLYGVVH